MEVIKVPTKEEIAGWSREACQIQRIRLKNEVSFARGNERGGPDVRPRIAALNEAIAAIEARVAAIDARHAGVGK